MILIFGLGCRNLPVMNLPLAFICYSDIHPGSQLANRLRDQGYRVQNLAQDDDIVARVRDEKPILAIIEIVEGDEGVLDLIRKIRSEESTAHLPVLGYASAKKPDLQDAGRSAGASLVAASEGLLDQLGSLLEHILQVD